MKIETSEEALQVVKMIAEMQEVCGETNITATKDKLLIQAIDGSQTAFVEAEIETSTGVEQEEKFGVNANDLATVLRALRGQTLKMETGEKNELVIKTGDDYSKEQNELTLFLEPAHDLEMATKAVRQIEHTQTVKIEGTQDFRTGLKLAGLIDEGTVLFETTKDNLFLITANGQRGTFKRRIRIKSGVHAKGLPTKTALNREQLLQLVKAKATDVQLHLGNNKPILIEYELGNAKTKIWVAPRIMDYESPTAKEEEIEELEEGAEEEQEKVMEAIA